MRVLRTAGAHPTPWNQLREYGPIGGMRWEPHPHGSPASHPGYGVSYQASNLMTAIAEVFQSRRSVDPITDAPAAVFWTPTRSLRLLDLTSSWPLRAQAAAALGSADRPVCCSWSRAIHDAFVRNATGAPIDGIHTLSTMTGSPVVVLFEPALNAFPAYPDGVTRLDSDLGMELLDRICPLIGYKLI